MLDFAGIHIFPFLITLKVHDVYRIIFKNLGVKIRDFKNFFSFLFLNSRQDQEFEGRFS